VARAIRMVSSTRRSIEFFEISDVDADAELAPKNNLRPRRFY